MVHKINQGGAEQVRVYNCGRVVTSHPTQNKIRDRLHYKNCEICKNHKFEENIARQDTMDLNKSIAKQNNNLRNYI